MGNLEISLHILAFLYEHASSAAAPLPTKCEAEAAGTRATFAQVDRHWQACTPRAGAAAVLATAGACARVP